MLMGLPPEGEIPDKPHASVHRLRLDRALIAAVLIPGKSSLDLLAYRRCRVTRAGLRSLETAERAEGAEEILPAF
jgi:hypothetical protein